MSLLDTFRKQGGLQLVKQYFKGGAMGTAVGELILLGKQKKALEILRLAAQYKIKHKLEKKYSRQIENFKLSYTDDGKHCTSDKVWICWFQGMENAPAIVRKCYESILNNLPGKDVVLITSKNMSEYVKFPDYIYLKWKKGIITNTHMTDLLRLELLINYGGMWIDATVLCTRNEKEIPGYYFNSDLFLYQLLKPGRDGQAQLISSWLISAKTNNKILMMTRYLCYEYWKKNNEMIDYYLLHDFLSIALEHNEQEWKQIIPADNSTPHILLLRLFDKYDEEMWNSITEQVPFHKLTYKNDEKNLEKMNSFYKKIIGN